MKMKRLNILFLVLIPYTLCYKLFEEFDSDDTEIVNVEIDSSSINIRNRRSEEIDYPRLVDYKLSVRGKDKRLHLTKTAHLDRDVPMYQMSSDHNLKLHQSSRRMYATYQDSDSGASILLQCDKTLPSCNLYGGFFHEGEHFRIQPHSQGSKHHRIAKTTRPMVAYRDTALHDDARSKGMPLLHDVIKKRAVSHGNNHVVEILVFLDDTIYDFFLKISGGNEEETLAKMKMYYTLIANDMDLRYQSLSDRHDKFKVDIMINGFVFSKTLDGFPWIPKYLVGNNIYDAENAMKLFGQYQYSNREYLPEFDHAMQFSRRDLAFYEDGWQSDLLGVAFKGTTCSTPSLAVSIIEDASYGTTGQTASHELGHSLGSSHDGAAGCNDDKQYIMAAFTAQSTKKVARHMWKMSECSSDAIYKYLNRLGNHVCTKKNSFSKTEYDKDHGLASGGQVYDLNSQCKLRQGINSFVCRVADTTICSQGIFCKIENTNYCQRILAMEGSDCGQGKICNEGKCVRQSKNSSNRPLSLGDKKPGLLESVPRNP